MTTSTPAHPFNAPFTRTRTKMTVEAKRARAAKKVDAMVKMHKYGTGLQPLDRIVSSKAKPINSLIADDNANPSVRHGSMDALALPSRVGDYLHYRDGTTRLAPIPTQAPINPYAAFMRG